MRVNPPRACIEGRQPGIAGEGSAHPMRREPIVSAARMARAARMNLPARKLLILCASTLLTAAAALGQSGKPPKAKPQKPARLRIEVTAGEKNQPVENASVYVKYAQERALTKDKKIEMNLKTNRDGVAKVPDIPRGKVLVQVIAEGWKPFGRWYDLEEDEQTIKIRLEKPPRWY